MAAASLPKPTRPTSSARANTPSTARPAQSGTRWCTASPGTCRAGPPATTWAYWQAADVYERANGQLYKEVEFALPVELPEQAGRHLAVAFAHQLTDAEHLPYTLTIHAGAGDQPARSPDD